MTKRCYACELVEYYEEGNPDGYYLCPEHAPEGGMQEGRRDEILRAAKEIAESAHEKFIEHDWEHWDGPPSREKLEEMIIEYTHEVFDDRLESSGSGRITVLSGGYVLLTTEGPDPDSFGYYKQLWPKQKRRGLYLL